MKVSLCMITLNAAETLEPCLRSIVPFVDEVSIVDTGSTDATEQIAREVCDDLDVPLVWGTWEDPERHPEKGWISDFAKARQLSVDQSTGDVWCWIDADTRMVAGRKWRDELDAFFGGHRNAENPGIMRIPYDYEQDAQGRVVRCVVAQMACRRDCYVWSGCVHELPQPIARGFDEHNALNDEYRFVHIKPKGEYKEALHRNLWILENHQAHGRPMTARLWQNLGATQMSLEDYHGAIESLTTSLNEDAMGPESYATLLSRACCHRSLGDVEAAMADFLGAARRHPERRTPYVYMAETSCDIGEWDKALYWLSIVDKLPESDGSTVYNPAWLKYGTIQIRARCLRELGMFEAALELYQQLSSAYPENQELAYYIQTMIEEMERGRLYKAYKIVTEGCDPQIASEIWKGCPDSIAHFPEPLMAHRPEPPKGARKVAIYCPMGRMRWGPRSLEGGVGGSEEAVIHMSRLLTQRGFHVEVYGYLEREDFGPDEHGVVWLPQYAFKDDPNLDIFVSWRFPRAVKLAPSAKLRVLWNHDVLKAEDFTREILGLTDVVFCLTQFHAKPLADLPGWAEKVIITKNGIDESYYVPERPRKRHSFAYYSSMDRGIDLLLEMWPKIRERLPDATLDIFYGFTQVYLDMMKGLPHLRELKDKIERLLRELEGQGITWRGMVGQKELAESMAETEFWLYPTSWPETSCITSMKCQALGCIPITSRYQDSGVPETTQFDLGPPGRPGMIWQDPQWQQEFIDAVVDAAEKEPVALEEMRRAMARWARKAYSWEQVADDWSLLFKTLLAKKSPVEIDA